MFHESLLNFVMIIDRAERIVDLHCPITVYFAEQFNCFVRSIYIIHLVVILRIFFAFQLCLNLLSKLYCRTDFDRVCDHLTRVASVWGTTSEQKDTTVGNAEESNQESDCDMGINVSGHVMIL